MILYIKTRRNFASLTKGTLKLRPPLSPSPMFCLFVFHVLPISIQIPICKRLNLFLVNFLNNYYFNKTFSSGQVNIVSDELRDEAAVGAERQAEGHVGQDERLVGPREERDHEVHQGPRRKATSGLFLLLVDYKIIFKKVKFSFYEWMRKHLKTK